MSQQSFNLFNAGWVSKQHRDGRVIRSRAHGSAMSRLFPRGMLSRIELVAGDLIEGGKASPEELRERVATLRGDRL